MIIAFWIPTASANAPCNTGINAPPSMAITNKDEPWLVYFPKPDIDNVYIFEYIIELNIPTPIIAHMAICPVKNIAEPTNKILMIAKINKVRAAADLPNKKPARLISIKNR